MWLIQEFYILKEWNDSKEPATSKIVEKDWWKEYDDFGLAMRRRYSFYNILISLRKESKQCLAFYKSPVCCRRSLRLLSTLWSDCCRFDTFPISFLNFIKKRYVVIKFVYTSKEKMLYWLYMWSVPGVLHSMILCNTWNITHITSVTLYMLN